TTRKVSSNAQSRPALHSARPSWSIRLPGGPTARAASATRSGTTGRSVTSLPSANRSAEESGAHRHRRHGIAVRGGERWDRIGRDQQEHAEDEADRRRPARRDPTPREGLLGRDERGDEGHPDEAHDAERKERGHQGPATSNAPGAVL